MYQRIDEKRDLELFICNSANFELNLYYDGRKIKSIKINLNDLDDIEAGLSIIQLLRKSVLK